MTRRIIGATLVVVLLVLLAGFLSQRIYSDQVKIHLSGDLAADLGSELALLIPASALVADAGAARVKVILVTDWEKLAFVPGAQSICSDACAPENGVEAVSILQPGLGHSEKHLIVMIDRFLGEPTGQETFAFSSSGTRCLSASIAREVGVADATLGPECGPIEWVRKWRLPFQ